MDYRTRHYQSTINEFNVSLALKTKSVQGM